VFDAFAAMGVPAAEIKEYIGHEIGAEDLHLLRAILQTLKQGDAKWFELIAEKRSAAADAKTPLADRLKAKAAKLEERTKTQPAAKKDASPPQDLAPLYGLNEKEPVCE
jgi:hypothetical protein